MMTILVNTSEHFERFCKWIDRTFVVGFDTETSIAELAIDRVLHMLVFGDYHEQYCFNWHRIPGPWKQKLTHILESERWLKVGHNIGQFDGGMLYVNGVNMQRVHDTMLTELVLETGINDEYRPLMELVWKYCYKLLEKDSQTTFGDPDMVLTQQQIDYMGNDVKYLLTIYRAQHLRLHQEDLEFVAALENDASLAYGEMSEEGIHLDVPYWLGLQEDALPIVEQSKKTIDAWLEHQDFRRWKDKIAQTDIIQLPLNSPVRLLELMKREWPDLEGTSKAVVQRYLRLRSKGDNPLKPEHQMILQPYAAGDKGPLGEYFIQHHRQYCIEQEFIIPKGTCLVNWNSPVQVLPIAQTVAPKLKGLSEKDLQKTNHPFFQDLTAYRDSLKLISTYGEAFVHKHVCHDGKVHTTYNQIVSTGRISSRSPNIQNIPAKEAVGNKYRNAFIPPAGWKLVDSDYASQELVVIAYISNDPVWNKALRDGEDLHSVCAELVFKKRWRDASEEGCAFHRSRQKCKCKGHKRLRDQVKTINFGLAYGMSEFELSGRLRISVQDARNLILEYFRSFPAIQRTLEFLGRFGVENGYIKTPAPFFRKRWFPYWKENRAYIEAHIQGVVNNLTLGEIKRASMNMPIQGGSADMMKTAMVLMRNWIIDNKARDRVKLVLQVHDQQTTAAREDFAEEWKPIMTGLMESAALLIVRSGLLKAETNVTDKWSK